MWPGRTFDLANPDDQFAFKLYVHGFINAHWEEIQRDSIQPTETYQQLFIKAFDNRSQEMNGGPLAKQMDIVEQLWNLYALQFYEEKQSENL